MKQQMQEAADNYAFEEAARLRDQLQAVARLNEAQKVVTNNGGDMDIFGLGQDMTGLCVQLFFVRKGKLIGRDNFMPDGGDTPQEVMTAFVKQYYNEATFIPKEVVLPYLPEEDEKQLIETWLADKAQRRVELLLPQRGVKKDLLKLANENAVVKLLNERWCKGSLSLKNDLQAAEELQQALGLSIL